MLQHAPFSLTGMEFYIKEKPQNEATNMLTGVDFMTYRLPRFARPSPLDSISSKATQTELVRRTPATFSSNMPTSYLSTLLSSIALCITTAKLSISVWRQYHEYTWKPVHTPKTKLWLQMGMSVVLLIFSGLLLAFACKEQEKALCILLSVAEVFMIIYQVRCLIF